jgi:hypothetical protein
MNVVVNLLEERYKNGYRMAGITRQLLAQRVSIADAFDEEIHAWIGTMFVQREARKNISNRHPGVLAAELGELDECWRSLGDV